MLKETDSLNLESNPKKIEEAKAYEEQLIKEAIGRYHESETIQLSNQGFVFTPSEHKMFGSTTYGLAFSPNKPYASYREVNLEKINQAREKLNLQEMQSAITVIVDNQKCFAVFQLLPIQPGNIESQTFQKTFQVTRLVNLKDEIISTTLQDLSRSQLEIEKILTDDQKQEQDLYYKKLNLNSRS